MKHTTFKIDTSLPGGGLGSEARGSGTVSNYIENKLIKEIEKIEVLIENNRRKIFKLKHLKNIITLEISDMSIFIDMLADTYQSILIKKFVEKKHYSKLDLN